MARQINSLEELESIIDTNRNIIVDCFTPTCGPCKAIGPVFDRLVSDYPTCLFVKCNVAVVREVAEYLEVYSVPTFIKFKDGEIVDRMLGGGSEKLKSFIEKQPVGNKL